MFSKDYLSSLSQTEKLYIYKNSINTYLNMESIFSDETNQYVNPSEPSSSQPVSIKIRTANNNVDKVFIHYSNQKFELTKSFSKDIFDYYEIIIPYIENAINYYFTIEKNLKTYYYNKKGLYDSLDEAFNFTIIANFNTPKWAKGAIMYQIYVDRFCNGDTSNDVVMNEYAYLGKAAKPITPWNKPIENEDVCNFYGGDLQGVIDKMSYLSDLGIDVIYFNPIFVSPSNHKYDIQDYDYIDPHYGVIVEDGGKPLSFDKFHNKYATMYMQRVTNIKNLEASNQLLINLINIAHSKGMKVLLDGVFNHCGAFNKWMDCEHFYTDNGYENGAYKDKNSIYNKYFSWYDENWPNNNCYDSWWGHENHPKLNFEESPELYNYILEVGKKWVSPPFNADGWRLDVAADLGHSKEFNHKFWRDFRKAVKSANSEAIILAEHYGDPKDWLGGDQWDTIMNYDAFMEPITWFLTGMQKHSEEFKEDMLCNHIAFENSMRYYMSRFSIQSLFTSMNQLSNHDHSRFLTRTNSKVGRLHTLGYELASVGINKNKFMEAVTFQMTWPGAPSIYYGDEAGLVGWTDPDNRRTYPWGKEDIMLLDFHKEIIKIHKTYQCLKTGSTEYLYLQHGFISYGRFDDNEKIVVLLNNNDHSKELNIPVWKIEVALNCNLESLIITGHNHFSTEKQIYKVIDGFLSITLQQFTTIVLREVKV